MPTITANNASFYYELHGEGHPVVLISGYTCDHQLWLPLIEKLSQTFQVLIFDNRGVGQTTDDGASLSVELMAQDVYALTRALKLQKPHLVGHSMGGAIAQYLASLYPKALNKLVLLSTASKWRQAMLKGMKSLLTLREKEMDPEILFESTLPWVFGESFLKDQKQILALKQAWESDPHPQSLEDQTRQFKVLEAFDVRKLLKDIIAPTLVIYGIQDIIALPSEAEFLASHIENSQLVPLDFAHGIPIEAPNELSKALLKFLQH